MGVLAKIVWWAILSSSGCVGSKIVMGACDKIRYETLNHNKRDYLIFVAKFTEEYLARRPFSREALALAAHALTTLGFYEDGLLYDRRLYSLRDNDPVVVYNLACSFALTENYDAAFRHLEQAIALGYNDAEKIRSDPDWEKVLHDQRFDSLLSMADAAVNGLLVK